MPRLQKLIGGIQPLLNDIRAVADGGGPVNTLDLSQGISVDTSHIPPLRHLARLLRADALVAREHNETQRIVDDIVAIMRLSDALACDPIRYSQFVRMAIASIAIDVLRFLPEGPLDAEHYEQLLGVFRDAYHREEFAASYGGEAVMLAALFERPPDPAFWAGSADNIFQAGTFHVLSSPLGRPVRNIDESNALDALASVRELALLPFWEAQPALTQIEAALDGRPWWSYSRSLLPGYMNLTRNFRAQADHEERMNLAQLGLAIEAVYARTGDFPESLREIEDQFPEGIPLCPVSGTPYVYSPGTEWFQLYGQLTYPRGAGTGGEAISAH